MPFFKTRPPITSEDAQRLLIAAFEKLDDYQGVMNWQTVTRQLRAKQLIIQQQIMYADGATKEKFIRSYFLFAETLTNCIATPAQQKNLVRNYHQSSDYYHIGGDEGQYSYTFMDNVMTKLAQISTIMLACSVVALPFELTAGLILLGVAIFILAPTLFYVIAETNGNKLEVQKEEQALFAAVATLVNPALNDVSANEHRSEVALTGS